MLYWILTGGIMRTFKFDSLAAKAAMLYVAQNAPKPTFAHIGKILYEADKLSLERTGRVISGDPYNAYPNGPLPQNTYNDFKRTQAQANATAPDGSYRIEYRQVDLGKPAPCIVALAAPDLGELSRSDLECLDEAIVRLGALRFAELSEKSHDAAWREAFERQTGDFEIRLDQMVETLPNAAQVRDYLENPHP
jgi:uncharacterized phage-associated protein